MTRSSTPPAARPTSPRKDPRSQLRRAVGLSDPRGFITPVWQALVTGLVFVAVSLAAFHSPIPRQARIDVVGPAAATAGIQTGLDKAVPGGFAVRRSSRAAALHDLGRGSSFAVIDLEQHQLAYAAANGPTVTGVVTRLIPAVLSHGGITLTAVDVLPLRHDDTAGLPLFYLVFGVVLASYLFTVTSIIAGARLPARGHWFSAALLALTLGGLATLLATTAVKTVGPGSGLVWLLLTLTSLATSSASYLLIRLSKTVGSLLASALLVIVASAAGGVLPGAFLPGWLAALRPLLPLGASLTGIRGLTYFHHQHLAASITCLLLWALLPLLAGTLLDRRTANRHLSARTGADVSATEAARTPTV